MADASNKALNAPDQDGWIEWKGGGECPVPAGTLTMVRFRNGRVIGDNTPTFWCWAHDGDEVDIVAYRVLAAPGAPVPARPKVNTRELAATLSEPDARESAFALAKAELARYLPIIEAAEADPDIWDRLTAGTGIATANGYRHALAVLTEGGR